MLQTITDKFARIEQLLHDKKYIEAIRNLSSIDRSSLTKKECGYYCLLYAEASIQVSDYSVENLIDEAIETFRQNETELFAKAKYLKGWLLTSTGKLSEARQVLIESYSNYLRCENDSMAARVLNRLAFVENENGNSKSAIHCLEESISLYKKLNDNANLCKVGHNLASVYYKAGRLRESIYTYQLYPVKVTRHGAKPLINYYYMSALPYALRGNIKKAKRIIKKAEPFLSEYVREKAIYYENLGFILLLEKKYDAAEDALTEGLYLAKEIAPGSALISQMKRLLAEVFLGRRDYLKAQKIAKEALYVAERINERVEIAACYRIFAQVEQYYGREGAARVWFEKAMEIFEEIGSQYELAVTQYMAATSGLYENGERLRLLVLAKEYFEREEIEPYLKPVTKLVTKYRALSESKSGRRHKGEPKVIGVTMQMKDLLKYAKAMAQSDVPILLTGETGTGKDLLAEYIHYHSGRQGQFISVNAAAIPATVFESELFGHAKGSFSGATQDRIGLLEEADGGTFFLNEIGDTPIEVQLKLLDALETHRIRRIGENRLREVNFRLISATNSDLESRIREGKFRQDLYHRLAGVTLELPPLEERKSDIPELVRYFLEQEGVELGWGTRMEVEQLGKMFMRRKWRGNIRELQQAVRILCLEARHNLSRMVDILEKTGRFLEYEELVRALEESDWNKSKAARLLGVSEGTVRRRIEKYNLKQPSSPSQKK